MTSAIGRSGGCVVGLLVALLTTRPPVRLVAQSAGTLLAVLPGSARAAGMGGAGAAIVGDGGARVGAWAGDVGLAIAGFDLMALGVSVQNIGGDFGPTAGGLHLPRRTRAGFTLNYVDPQGTLRLLTTVEGQWPAGGGSAFVVLGLGGGGVTRGMGVLGRLGYVGHSGVTSASPFTAGGSVGRRPPPPHYTDPADRAPGARHPTA